ncbi:uncharacterized protein [Coffea arabica]|uniref:CCHC-type domain-containing protein n=1 Tax=Coffea arabica TaxID=13443 RepID=A0ABM4VC78_COFAR
MTEDLEEILRKFALTEDETGGVELDSTDLAQGVVECQLSIIGRVVGEKTANIAGIKSFASNMWPFARNLRVVEIGVNMFQFSFSNKQDMDRVLRGRPWVYDNLPWVVLPWEEGIELNLEAFNRTWIWVQLWNLPIHWITKDIGRKIGGVFSSVREVIAPNGGGKKGKLLKILVEMDLTKPMLRGTTVKLRGSSRWIDFKYEKCPDFCYCCGVMGHNERSCRERGGNMDKENQYGAWLRASNARSHIRKQNSSCREKGKVGEGPHLAKEWGTGGKNNSACPGS